MLIMIRCTRNIIAFATVVGVGCFFGWWRIDHDMYQGKVSLAMATPIPNPGLTDSFTAFEKNEALAKAKKARAEADSAGTLKSGGKKNDIGGSLTSAEDGIDDDGQIRIGDDKESTSLSKWIIIFGSIIVLFIALLCFVASYFLDDLTPFDILC